MIREVTDEDIKKCIPNIQVINVLSWQKKDFPETQWDDLDYEENDGEDNENDNDENKENDEENS